MQNSSNMSKSEGDKKLNVQISEEKTSPDNDNLSNKVSSPDTDKANTLDTVNRKQHNQTGVAKKLSTTPDTGMPMDIGTPPRTDTPMNGTTPRSGMPMNGITPRTGMPMNGTTPRSGMPMNGTTPRSGMPMNGTTPRTGMPMNGTTPRTGMPMNGTSSGNIPLYPVNGQYMPPCTPYNTPMGVPLYPLYGYDNCEDLDRDMKYMKQIYPNTAKRIQREIDNECDKLEYDGSIMFDECPDKVSLERIIDRVYERVKDMDEVSEIGINSFSSDPRRRQQNLLRDLVTIVLLNEMFHRRRRRRSRRRWF